MSAVKCWTEEDWKELIDSEFGAFLWADLVQPEDEAWEYDKRVSIAVLPWAEWEAQQRRIQELEQWVADLQSGMFVNCVYCGHRYGPSPGTPVAMAEVLKQHIEKCPKHPMSILKARNMELEQEMERLKRNMTIEQFVERVERLAELKMLETGKLEGAHYAAMKAIMKERQGLRP